jgi:sortase A
MPEYSSDGWQLPSFASAKDAPSIYDSGRGSQPQRLTIPKLGIDAPVSRVQLFSREEDGQNYYQWQVPRSYEIGWHDTSALLGTKGNTVLNGHNNIYGQIFKDLIDLEIGEEIIVYDETQSYVYQVTQREILPENGQPLEVRLDNAKWIRPTSDERLTLITCWPFTTNSHRLVVIAKPVGATES